MANQEEFGDQIIKNLQNRDIDRVKKLLNHIDGPHLLTGDEKILIATASSDLGVIRNGGRSGSRFAPMAIINCLKKFSLNQLQHQVALLEVGHFPSLDFEGAQSEQTGQICSILKSPHLDCFFHLGGGHDHIYSLLKSLDQKNKRLIVVNIDAHLDTRTDNINHSGTPFRQFAKHCQSDFFLLQVGIHPFANSESSFESLDPHSMQVLNFEMILKETDYFRKSIISSIEKRLGTLSELDQIILSLDCDALEAQMMEGVSAVNGLGLDSMVVKEIFDWYQKKVKRKIIGIYEYNPLFDNLSQKGAKFISSLIYPFLT